MNTWSWTQHLWYTTSTHSLRSALTPHASPLAPHASPLAPHASPLTPTPPYTPANNVYMEQAHTSPEINLKLTRSHGKLKPYMPTGKA
ncbi:hypothetical protein Hamer_G019767 [Homarus americanus]|uniref:Uncharacterized protein n=1 Tax=Homarus americanus TaxID=6706 RepID=A0A8J5JLF9_HOMAM|nr:hypothetical protein Hamer_G019767 [Homarus americanus]